MHPYPIRAAVFDIDGTLVMMDKDSGTYAAQPNAVGFLAADPDLRAQVVLAGLEGLLAQGFWG